MYILKIHLNYLNKLVSKKSHVSVLPTYIRTEKEGQDNYS